MDLPEDVVFKILLKFPVRSLLRFKCICKDWCAMIESSHFKDTYLAVRRAKAVDDQVVGLKMKDYGSGIDKSFVTCWYEDLETIVQSASAPSYHDYVEITGKHSRRTTLIDHVNGIICVMERMSRGGNYLESGMKKDNWFDITLLNPALREFRKLPVPDLGGQYSELGCSARNVGFGYDDATDDYKVFMIVSFGMHGIYKGLVYHLSTNSWRILGDMMEFVNPNGVTCFSTSTESVFFQGSLHFYMAADPNDRIIAFNLTTESFQEINFPRGWSYYDGLRSDYDGHRSDYGDDTVFPHLLTIDKSTLALVAFSWPIINNQETGVEKVLDVWVMKEYGDSESWIKLYSVTPLPDLPIPLSFWRKDKLLLVDNRLFCYDLFTGQVNDCGLVFDSDGQQQDEHGPWKWSLYILSGHESFVSLKQECKDYDEEDVS